MFFFGRGRALALRAGSARYPDASAEAARRHSELEALKVLIQGPSYSARLAKYCLRLIAPLLIIQSPRVYSVQTLQGLGFSGGWRVGFSTLRHLKGFGVLGSSRPTCTSTVIRTKVTTVLVRIVVFRSVCR